MDFGAHHVGAFGSCGIVCHSAFFPLRAPGVRTRVWTKGEALYEDDVSCEGRNDTRSPELFPNDQSDYYHIDITYDHPFLFLSLPLVCLLNQSGASPTNSYLLATGNIHDATKSLSRITREGKYHRRTGSRVINFIPSWNTLNSKHRLDR